MKKNLTLLVSLLAAGFLTGCGTSSEGSRYNAQHGVAKDSGYPTGHPADAASPALGSSRETEVSKEGPRTEHPGAERPNKDAFPR